MSRQPDLADPPRGPAEESLRRLAEACAAGGGRFTPLPPGRFDEAHEAYERSSGQQQAILRSLQRLAAGLRRHEAPLRILSVGPGNGMLDLPLIEALSRDGGAIEYVGVDPNRVAADRFRDGFRAIERPGVSLTVHACGVDDLADGDDFDFVHAVHSLYYVPQPAETLSRLLERLRPAGRLAAFQAPRGDLNALAECFWRGDGGRSIWFSDRLEAWLRDSGHPFETQRLDAWLDVTRALDADDARGRLVLDFVLQTEFRGLAAPIAERALDCLRAISRSDGDRRLAAHPVDAFVVSRA